MNMMAFGKLSLVLSILVAGLGGVFAWIHDPSSRAVNNRNQSAAVADSIFAKSKDQFLFRETLLFDGKTEGGFRFTTQTYQSWDCMILRKRVEFLDSPDNAKSEFKKTIGQAAELLEHREQFDTTGQLVGERAVARFTEDKEPPEILILWTEDSELYSIASSSLEHALKLEAWLKTSDSRPASTPDKDFVFEAASSTNGTTNKGRSFSEHLFRSNDCVIVSSRIEYFDSPADAQNELKLRVKDAVEIVGKDSEASVRGAAVGDRTVAIFAPDLPSEFSHSSQVLWTEGSELHIIRSTSLPHVLAFEKLSR
jgi:hypothetical protein